MTYAKQSYMHIWNGFICVFTNTFSVFYVGYLNIEKYAQRIKDIRARMCPTDDLIIETSGAKENKLTTLNLRTFDITNID